MKTEENKIFHTEQELKVSLSSFESEQILSVFPKQSKIKDSQFFDNYDLPCPIKVVIELPDNKETTVVLGRTEQGEVRIETDILKTLHKLGCPVPEVLIDPIENPKKAGEQITILSLLPGVNVQKLSMGTKEDLQKAKELIIDGIKRLTEITERISQEPIAQTLPHLHLIDQFKAIQNSEKPWSDELVFKDAIQKLKPVLEKISTPLVFTNGDYQPANFLTDRKKITGLVDFESASFQDPLIGLVKYPIYDLHPLNQAGFVDDFLKANGYSNADFAPRLALGCLMTLQKEIPVKNGSKEDNEYRDRVLGLLSIALEQL